MFKWEDGPLLRCMKEGGVLFIDEVNMCPESVLEGLNSVFEMPSTVTVNDAQLKAHERFFVVAAMNPSGDWGKRELTPALRSRFTEIFLENPMELPEMPSIVGQLVPAEFS